MQREPAEVHQSPKTKQKTTGFLTHIGHNTREGLRIATAALSSSAQCCVGRPNKKKIRPSEGTPARYQSPKPTRRRRGSAVVRPSRRAWPITSEHLCDLREGDEGDEGEEEEESRCHDSPVAHLRQLVLNNNTSTAADTRKADGQGNFFKNHRHEATATTHTPPSAEKKKKKADRGTSALVTSRGQHHHGVRSFVSCIPVLLTST